ncbi:hypothetical protein [Sphingosinicella sp.]|uniref:hypothetical protein n=1 Tax=Sphingosinicella sp. TaxID=1917971 RepID=UPI0040378656
MTILAVLFAPLSMMGGHAAMAMPNPAPTAVMDHDRAGSPAGHCADMDQDQSGPTNPSIDCMIACSAVPSAEFAVASHPAGHGIMQVGRLASLHPGLHPESDPPPPRLS